MDRTRSSNSILTKNHACHLSKGQNALPCGCISIKRTLCQPGRVIVLSNLSARCARNEICNPSHISDPSTNSFRITAHTCGHEKEVSTSNGHTSLRSLWSNTPVEQSGTGIIMDPLVLAQRAIIPAFPPHRISQTLSPFNYAIMK